MATSRHFCNVRSGVHFFLPGKRDGKGEKLKLLLFPPMLPKYKIKKDSLITGYTFTIQVSFFQDLTASFALQWGVFVPHDCFNKSDNYGPIVSMQY